ncbi:hypothetical protein ACFPU1_12860 [Thalassorhabdus alkalitolerans]|uniref:Phage derived protein Gp49-like n=1 Tax=Thalassorhabdus alkalitolerans TaxID=2282697 RepID=A0ABW0YUG5_9BACI|nr:hypothetical protein [Thalassobacillus sp. C254]
MREKWTKAACQAIEEALSHPPFFQDSLRCGVVSCRLSEGYRQTYVDVFIKERHMIRVVLCEREKKVTHVMRASTMEKVPESLCRVIKTRLPNLVWGSSNPSKEAS